MRAHARLDGRAQRGHSGIRPPARCAALRGQPKVLLLAAAGGIVIGSAGLSTTETLVSVTAFTAIAAVTVALPVLLFIVLGERILVPLGRTRDWLDANNAAVMAAVITVIGVLLAYKGYSGL